MLYLSIVDGQKFNHFFHIILSKN